MPTFTRLQIVLDLARAGRSAPRLHLQARLRESAADEIFRRAPALGLAALPAMLLTLLLALSGLLELPSAFDPQSWPSMASLSSKSGPGPEDSDAAAPPAADPTETKDDDEASIEPTEDPSRYDPPSPGGDETGQQDGGVPEEDESEKGSSGDDGSASSGAESSESGTEAGDGSEGSEGRQSSSSGEAAPDPGETGPGGTEPAPSGEPSSDGGEGSASGGDPASAAAPAPGETGDAGDGSADSPGDPPAPGQGASAGGEGRQASEAQAGQGGSGSGQDETEAKDAWGLGSGSPLGEATSLEPPAASDVITLHLPVLGSQTVRLEDEEAPPSAAADAPPGPRSRRRGPGEPLEERAEPDPSPPQQPLPAWIVRLLRGKG